jgi:hypothetical protein
MDYKQILEDVLEIEESITVIIGYADIIGYSDITNNTTYNYYFKDDLTNESFWRVIGRGDDDLILESLQEFQCEVDMEGEYEFKSVLKWIPGDYDEYGRCTMRDYLEIEHIEFNFIQTFQERERESKLSKILSDEFEDLFKI